MYPIMGRYGPFFLYSFMVVWVVGGLVGLRVSYWLSPTPKKVSQWLDPMLIAGIFSLIFGRLVFIWLNADYFQAVPSEWWQIQRGGLAYGGVLLGIVLAMMVWSRLKPIHWTVLAPLVPIFQVTGWVACYLEGCGYGRPALPSWFVGELPDAFGVIDLRYQTQLIAIGVYLLALLWLVWARHEGMDGKLQWWCMWLLVGVGNAGISLLRADLTTPTAYLNFSLLISIIATTRIISLLVTESSNR